MKNRAWNKILSFILAAALLMGFIPGAGFGPMTAYAAAGDRSDGADITAGNWAGVSPNHRSYYFGTYNGAPIPWRVLSSNGTDDALLLSENILTTMAFRSTGLNVWAKSTIRAYLNGDFINGLPAELQTQGVLVETSITEAGQTTSDKVYLLSEPEADTLSQADRAAGSAWWLRSPIGDCNAVFVYFDGSVRISGNSVYYAYGVRPALKVSDAPNIFKGPGAGTLGDPYTIDPSGSVPPSFTIASDTYVKFSVSGTDITWKVIEAAGDTITLFPTDVIGSGLPFYSPWNKWSESDVRAFLNPTGNYAANTFGFAIAEGGLMKQTSITESGDVQVSDTMFLLSTSEARTSNYFANNTDRAKSSTRWWLRSPGYFDYNAALIVNDGSVDDDGLSVDYNYGVRPAFKLNLSSVIFTSEILSDVTGRPDATPADSNYTAAACGGGAKNYKLTVVDSTLNLSGLTAGGQTVSASEHPTVQATAGGTIAMTGTGSAGTNLTYKIVNSSGTLVGYGQGDNTNVDVYAKNLDGTSLADDSYTVYVWAQENNATTSHTGSTPWYFTMTVSSTQTNNPPAAKVPVPPQIAVVSQYVSVEPTFTAADIATDIDNDPLTIRDIKTAPDGTCATATLGASGEVTVTGVAAGTTSVEVTVSDGTDAVDITVPIVVYNEPLVPSVYPDTLTIYKGETGTAYVFLGQNADEAASATVTSGDDNIATATPTSINTTGSALTIEGVSAGTATITLGWSGGNQDSTTSTVTVTVENKPHAITVQNDGNGTASADKTTATVGETITLSASPNNGYKFSGWTVISGGVSVNSSSSASTTFAMPDNEVTLKANFVSTGGNGGSSSGGSDRDSGSTYDVKIEEKKPDQPTIATLDVYADIEKNGHATVTDAMVKALIEQAQAAASNAGKTSDGIGIKVNILFGSTANSIAVTIEGAAVTRMNSTANLKLFGINNPLVNFSFNTAAIKEINTQRSGNVTVTATPEEKLSVAAAALIGSRPVFDLTVSYQKSGKTEYITSFGKGAVTIGIAYTPKSGEKTGNLYAVYVPGNGKPELLTESSYDSGRVIFSRSTLSVYGVGYKTPAPAFTDTATHWAKDNIDFVASRGLLTGTSDTTFSPNTAITRGMFVTALGRLSGQDVSGYTSSSFSDVAAGSYYLPYIEWAVKNKIVSGTGGGKFEPDRNITREEMALMMYNYANATNYDLPFVRETVTFADGLQISSWAADAVKDLQQAGIVSGVGNNRFNPKGTATRAEAATILRNFVELVIDPGTARGWVQNDAGQQMYYTWDGKRVSGWLTTTSGSKYWFDDNGIIQAGKWVEIGGKWYYFHASGKLAVSTTINGYEVGEDGARK